jgi:hypothetical protein
MADASGEGRKERRETFERQSFAVVIGCVLDSMKSAGWLPLGAGAKAGDAGQGKT